MEKTVYVKVKDSIQLSRLKRGVVHRFQVHLSDNSLGVPWKLPVIIIQGKKKGKVLGITAAIHGNELNGISTIYKLIQEVDPMKMSGTLILIPISNVPGYLKNQRYFIDNVDLNRIMPGKSKGAASSIYTHHLINKVIKKFDYLLDLHTASMGRVNSLYIRADLDKPECRNLAYLQNPQIIVQKSDESGTLRGWANDNGINAITIEIGNPNGFQHKLIDETLLGILNTMKYLKIIEGKVRNMVKTTTICDHSFWLYSSKGGLVDVFPVIAEKVEKGQLVAKVYDVFGQVREEIFSTHSGIVIGKNIRPNCDAGTRVLHLGI